MRCAVNHLRHYEHLQIRHCCTPFAPFLYIAGIDILGIIGLQWVDGDERPDQRLPSAVCPEFQGNAWPS